MINNYEKNNNNMRYQNNDNNCDAKYLNKFRNKSYVRKKK